jgi:hypothetical protein
VDGRPTVPPTTTTPNDPHTTLQNQPPATFDLEAATQAYLKANVVYVPFAGDCSGLLLRDGNNTPVGVATASHCGFRYATRRTDASGAATVTFSQAPDVYLGDDVAHLTKVGTVTRAVVPQPGDESHDFAILAFGDHLADAERAWDRNAIPDDQITKVPPRQELYLSGYPEAEPTNTTGAVQRATLQLLSLGAAEVFGANGQVIPALLSGSTASRTDTICSFGDSGAVAVESIETNSSTGPRLGIEYVGVLSGFDDFRAVGNVAGESGPQIKAERQREYNLDLSGVDYGCLVDSERPNAAGANPQMLTVAGPSAAANT